MKVADYIANFVAEKGVRYIHTIMGGGAATLNDSFGKHPDLKYVPYHSEAGASYAAFGEAKFTNQVAIINPTTGIAGVNAMAGVLSAWQDSSKKIISMLSLVLLPRLTISFWKPRGFERS